MMGSLMGSRTIHRAIPIIWFALLVCCPAFLGTNASRVADIASQAAFASHYWLIACVGVACLLVPKSTFKRFTGGHAPSCMKPALCGFGLAVAAWWNVFSVVAPVVIASVPFDVDLQILCIVWFKPLGIAWSATSCISTALCVLNLRMRAAQEECQTKDDPSCPQRGMLSFVLFVIVGVFAPVALIPFEPTVWNQGIARAIGSLPNVTPIWACIVPSLLLAVFLWRIVCASGFRMVSLAVAGVLYGRLLVHLLLRVATPGMLCIVDRPFAAWAVVVAAIVILFAIALQTPLAPSDNRQKDGDEESAYLEARDIGAVIAAKWGLTEREAQAASYAMEGKTSRQTADCMGASASTVRGLRSRAWRKMGVASAQEARALLEKKADQCGEEKSLGGRGLLKHAPEHIEKGLGVALCIALLPWRCGEMDWFVPVNVSVSLGCALLGPLLMRAAGLKPVDVYRWMHIACLALSISLAIIGRLFVPDVLPCAAFAIAFCFAFGLDAMRGDDTALTPLALKASLVVLACAFGCLFYLSWRESVWPYGSSVWNFSLFVAFLAVAPWLSLWRSGAYMVVSRRVATVISFILLCSWAFESRAALLVAAALSLCAVLHLKMMREKYADASIFALGGACLGFLAGPYVLGNVEYAISFKTFFSGTVAALTYQVGVSAVIGAGVLCVIASGLVLCWELRALDGHLSMESVGLPADAGRVRSALHAKGLSELEATVVAASLEGQTCAQIARKINYAKSTVYAARREAYRKLGVRDLRDVAESIRSLVEP
ncbi:helix-turn-helix transcriptional regulator [Collinsella ihumii]|uniref:helix-turn-helix transcriptional regulator n=1 Tax=Collinsella ihumii TaxID=1720204 RepID=UPI0025AA3F20|nr:LuxR C-terminal-related transcriptional regulator [Collinsella ihumii]MDN0055793.1 LuxR C-terminal-related transcriptional regulator [Collinsella ihumii]